jgi:tetratricopeptide (TPR) repeat protein
VDQTDRYCADGQVRDEDYEYASFLSSRMHQRGVYCLDCHNPHSMKVVLPGNWLCLRCHSGSDTNAPVINPVTHSHHQVYGFDTNGQPVNLDLAAYKPREIAQKGGECVNCHMPQTLYMQKHWRHDHGFTIPDPLLTKQFGIPNACNRCHQDKDTDWSLKYCNEWYADKMDRPGRRRAQIIARAQRRDPNVRGDLLQYLNVEDSPYWRSVLLGLLEPWSSKPEVTTALRRGLDDTNALVRTVSAGVLERALDSSGSPVAEALRRRLNDPVRSVRIAAASSLRASLDLKSPAGRELARYLEANADEPSGQLQTALFCLSRNELPSALAHLERAIKWDPYSAPLRQQLAVVLSALNRPKDALEALKQASQVAPDNADIRFHLGLAYNEVGDLKSAAEQLAAAVRLDPLHASAWYNLGLAQNSLEQPETAVESLLRAEAVEPEDARIPYARATILARLGQTKEARRAAMRSLELEPSSTEAKALVESLGR